MKMKALLLVLLTVQLVAPLPQAFARIDVVFLGPEHKENTMPLEEGGHFNHVAIFYNGRWLHAHPYRGVELIAINQLLKLGRIEVIMTDTEASSLSEKDVSQLLGQPYDHSLSWEGNGFYCSNLIGRLLNIPPRPMLFNSPFWPVSFQSLVGKPGLSPDDVFDYLINNGFKPQYLERTCSNLLKDL